MLGSVVLVTGIIIATKCFRDCDGESGVFRCVVWDIVVRFREGGLSSDGCVVVVEVMSLYHDPVSVILYWN
jgi:hypothetical protein